MHATSVGVAFWMQVQPDIAKPMLIGMHACVSAHPFHCPCELGAKSSAAEGSANRAGIAAMIAGNAHDVHWLKATCVCKLYGGVLSVGNHACIIPVEMNTFQVMNNMWMHCSDACARRDLKYVQHHKQITI